MAGEVAAAYLNWARWIIECPFCQEATRVPFGVFHAQPRFVCPACGWESQVAFPAEAQEIMTVLIDRPQLDNRNWKPGETIEQLLIDNAAHLTGGEVKV